MSQLFSSTVTVSAWFDEKGIPIPITAALLEEE
jgi:hypothetical protein